MKNNFIVDPIAPPKVLDFWVRYVSHPWMHERVHHDVFVERLRTCDHLRWLCEPGLSNPGLQHGVVFALFDIWEDEHREEEVEEIDPIRPAWRRSPRGRRPEFLYARYLLALAYLVRKVLTETHQRPAHYWAYTTKILYHFFKENFPTFSTDDELDYLRKLSIRRAKHFRSASPGDSAALAEHWRRDAMDMVEAFTNFSRQV